MTNPHFDWIMLLPEDERKAALAQRTASNEAFFKGFPIHPNGPEARQDAKDLRRAGISGRAALDRALAIIAANPSTGEPTT